MGESNFGFNFKGMYLTEFAGWGPECVKQHGGDGSQGQALVAQFGTPIVKNHPRMSRFAWFNDFETYPGQGSSNLFHTDGHLSNVGQAYLTAVLDGTSTVTSPGPASTNSGSTTDAATTTVATDTTTDAVTSTPNETTSTSTT